MDHELMDKPGLQTEGRTKKSNPNFANHPKDEIAKIEDTTSTSRPVRLTASSRHLGETLGSFAQLKSPPGRSKTSKPAALRGVISTILYRRAHGL